MNNVFNRVATWNSRRYDREYDHNLTLALLTEEYTEWCEADSEVKKLDGLCDIIYVALGAIWKLDVTDEANEEAEAQANYVAQGLVEVMDEPHYAYFISTHLAVLKYESDYPILVGLHMIIKAAMMEMLSIGLTYEQSIKALLVVCDSNDSKSVKKTASNVKANDKDKGEFFVAPEPRLQAILDNRG